MVIWYAVFSAKNCLFRKKVVFFAVSGEKEAGSAGVQLARDNLMDKTNEEGMMPMVSSFFIWIAPSCFQKPIKKRYATLPRKTVVVSNESFHLRVCSLKLIGCFWYHKLRVLFIGEEPRKMICNGSFRFP